LELSRQIVINSAFGVNEFKVPDSWCKVAPIPSRFHDKKFIKILKAHGFSDIQSPVPLVGRYTKGRRWKPEEFEACYAAWKSGTSITLIAAGLNRNPQDIIYKLLERCKSEKIDFTEKGRSEGSKNWTPTVANCAAKLFEAGLPAWKIAALFQVDFEHVEKALFLNRSDYGHRKMNPFVICTDHKHLVNQKVVKRAGVYIRSALDAFAGEGSLTTLLEELFPEAMLIAVEANPETFSRAQKKTWGPNVSWLNEDNCEVMTRLVNCGARFDLIDLDPFVTCYEQAQHVWKLLNPESLLFVTFGGEYRRSFIRTNRKAIAKRYGFYNESLSNPEYLEVVPYFALGWLAMQAATNGFYFEVIRAIRYPNNCRFWTKVIEIGNLRAKNWLLNTTTEEYSGWRFKNLVLPRFRNIRRELDNRDQASLFDAETLGTLNKRY
jgi:hypothetical protein